MLARVVGKHCESGDIVVKDEFLPADVAPGDLLAVPATGAYCRSMASNYNHVPRPPVVAVARRAPGSSSAGRPRTTCSPWTSADRRRVEWRVPADLGPEPSQRAVRAATASIAATRCGSRRLTGWRAWEVPCASRCSAAARSAPRSSGCCTSRPTTSPPGSAPARAGRHRRAPARPRPRRPAGRPVAVHHRRGGLVTRDDVDIVVEVIGGIEPARVADPHRARARRVRRHRQQGAARRGRRDAARRRPTSTAPTSTTRPPSPARSRCCARCASRCPATGSAGSSASSTAPPTSSSPGWTRPAPASPRRWTRRTALGYAEADPTADVEGFDAAAKAAILAALAFHTRVTAADVHREGITEVTAADVASAQAMGCAVKLLAIAERRPPTAAASASACTRR